MEPIIEVKDVDKKYKITHERGGYVSLRDVLMNILRRPFSYLKHKAKIVTGQENKEDFWALKNVSFTINKGEVVGIIGHNGAGKSTLLKILSQITPPTNGEIIMRGTVGSLLEVGTGFHPELTGRENIFLNGAILGMSRKVIASKFDRIVEFSGIGKFLDTPVKYYSSGMYVRLAFSVAAHMEPDILLVDEVLAVGDAEFQKKCLGKMEEVTKKEGRTIIFVSHNLVAIQNLCKRCILLEKGKITMIGPTEKVIDVYFNNTHGQAVSEFNLSKNNTDKEVQISKISIFNPKNVPSAQIPISEEFFIEIEYEVNKKFNDAVLSILFFSNGELLLLTSEADKTGEIKDYEIGKHKTRIKIPAFLFNVGRYDFEVKFDRPFVETIECKKDLAFEILDVNNPRSDLYRGNHPGKIAPIIDFVDYFV